MSEGTATALAGASLQPVLAAAMERTPDLVLVLGEGGVVVHANAAATAGFGLVEPVGRPAPEICDALSREVLIEAITRAMQGEPVLVEISLGTPPVAVELTLVPIEQPGGTPLLVLTGRRRTLAPLVEQRLGELNRRYDEKVRELASLTGKLRELATTDALTNLFNRRAFLERAQVEWSRARRHGVPLACVAMDIDHFKRINDRFGHAAGDDVLKVVGSLLRTTVRASDIPARMGGEEFIALLPQTSESGAALLAERVRSRIREHSVTIAGGEQILITLSAGVACSDRPFNSLQEMLAAADQALYRAKGDGRDCVRLASSLEPSARAG